MRCNFIAMRYRAAILGAFLASGLNAQPFYPDDPIVAEPDPMRVEDVEYRKLNDHFDLFSHLFGKLGEQHPPKGDPIRAQSTNTLDEVPDNRAWFTNRIGAKAITPHQAALGPGNSRGPADGDWTIVAAKTEGVTPGFRIKDSTGQQYVLKFDPLDHPEMATAADVIGSLLFHGLGYNVPENYVVEFDDDRLVIDEGATIPDNKGYDRPIERFDVQHALLRVPRAANGMIRGVASRLLSGKIAGEFRYYGTRSDDHNDTVPHEHRRELRGLHVFCAWLNHNDSRAINDLDSLVDEGSLRYVKHFLIDFGAILGSASILSNTARDGNAYFYERGPAAKQFITLGLFVPRWARAKYYKSEAVGMANWDKFDPEDWKPNYPSPAFDNRLPDDNFWAAKKVMAFTDEHIRAIVKRGKYSNPEDEEWTVRYLAERRDRIGKRYFAGVLPVDELRVANGKLAFEDLAVKYGFGEKQDYQIEWSVYDNKADSLQAISGARGSDVPSSNSDYIVATLSLADDPRHTLVYLRNGSSGRKVVGVKRFW